MIKPSFYKKNDVELETAQMFTEKVEKKEIESKEVNNINSKKKNLSILDVNTVKYIIENFSSISVEISEALTNLVDTLENTIDYIEDKSSDVIKKERNFKLSDSHRKISMQVYDMVKSIEEYVKWMEDEHEKGADNILKYTINKSDDEKVINIDNKSIKSNIEFDGGIEIYKDFSLKNPKAFKLDNNVVEVEDWDDLLVKTAEILNKQYKENKNSDKIIDNNVKIVEKKSNENNLRDTVIEMLNEYKIKFSDFKLMVQEK